MLLFLKFWHCKTCQFIFSDLKDYLSHEMHSNEFKAVKTNCLQSANMQRSVNDFLCAEVKVHLWVGMREFLPKHTSWKNLFVESWYDYFPDYKWYTSIEVMRFGQFSLEGVSKCFFLLHKPKVFRFPSTVWALEVSFSLSHAQSWSSC